MSKTSMTRGLPHERRSLYGVVMDMMVRKAEGDDELTTTSSPLLSPQRLVGAHRAVRKMRIGASRDQKLSWVKVAELSPYLLRWMG